MDRFVCKIIYNIKSILKRWSKCIRIGLVTCFYFVLIISWLNKRKKNESKRKLKICQLVGAHSVLNWWSMRRVKEEVESEFVVAILVVGLVFVIIVVIIIVLVVAGIPVFVFCFNFIHLNVNIRKREPYIATELPSINKHRINMRSTFAFVQIIARDIYVLTYRYACVCT